MLLPYAAGAGSWSLAHPHPQPHSSRAVWMLCANPSSVQPLPNPLQGQCVAGITSRTPGEVVLQLPASTSAGPGTTWPLPLAAGPFLAGVTQRQGTLAQACPKPLPTLLPLPSSPFLPPFPQGPNSQLCCSINTTIIILSLDT